MKQPTPFSHLPVSDFLESIAQKLQAKNRLILQAEPGAGKSTAVPWFLVKNLDLQGKKIIMLEPRRLAASSLAHYLSHVFNEKVGETVGYQIKNERRVSSKTRLEIVTEGVLTARIQKDPELKDVGLLIFDEFHERSLHADFGLALSKEIMQVYNESLKVLVMSATLDTHKLSDFLDKAPVIKCPGRCYPVTVAHLKSPIASLDFRDWRIALLKLVLQASQATDGDVLVFLPGQREILRLSEDLTDEFTKTRQSHSTIVTPLYGQLKPEQQKAALQIDKQKRQKIILATNIAETSLTIPNISAVVDSGLAKNSIYDVTSGMTRLLTQRISKASAEQRMGRAGRLQAGHCYRLWTETQQKNMPDYLPEAILHNDLTQLRLNLAQWGIKQSDDMQWLTQPPSTHLDAATELLQSLAFLDQDLNLTKEAFYALQFNLEPRLLRCLMTAKQRSQQSQNLACDLVAVLTDQHFYHSQDDADLVNRLEALQAYKGNKLQALKRFSIKASVVEQVATSAAIYRKKLSKLKVNNSLPAALDNESQDIKTELGILLAAAYPDRIAKRHSPENQAKVNYVMSNGKTAVLKWPNRLKASEWLVVVDLDGQRRDGQIYLATPIEYSALKNHKACKTDVRYEYNAQKNKLEGKQVTSLGAIILEESALKKPDKTAMQVCLFEAIEQTQLQLLTWNKKIKLWLSKVCWLMETATEATKDWPDFSHSGLLSSLDEWLFPYISQSYQIEDLATIDLFELIKNRLDYSSQQAISKQAPDYYIAPSGKAWPIKYQTGQLPKVSLQLQELFSELSSPTLAWGQVNLSFELLSPARRAIQTTSDLAQFWQTSYFDIAKEMRGRYPKHRWPQEPLLEKPGRSIKT